MYSVLVAEDEPLALKTICSIIEKYCPDYRVEATAVNGTEAYSLIKELRPDLVISDIKMPKMSGVELAEAVREEFPQICFIIVSGYQDFEYTQSAIRSGVTDYLLKPLMPEALQKSMSYAAKRIRLIQYRERNRILGQMGRDEAVDALKLKRYFPHGRYYGVLIRTNGLPRRFNIDRNREIYSDIDEQFIVFGRDEMEGLYLIPEELFPAEELVSYAEKLQKNHDPQGYHTLIYDEKSFTVSGLPEKVRALYRGLDLNSTVGYSQVIELKSSEKETGYDRMELVESLQRIEATASTGNREALRQEIRQALLNWAEKKKPQLWMEGYARDIISILRRHDLISLPLNECEYLLGDVFSGAVSAEMLNDSLLEIYMEPGEEAPSQKAGSKEYFEQITAYLDRHLHEPVSLQEICDTFAISQAYMSRLFRKYTSHSFNKYLTERRMQKAQELFAEDPGRYIREVAQMVGYSDQFYFSRIFRTYTGKSPTEFIREKTQD